MKSFRPNGGLGRVRRKMGDLLKTKLEWDMRLDDGPWRAPLQERRRTIEQPSTSAPRVEREPQRLLELERKVAARLSERLSEGATFAADKIYDASAARRRDEGVRYRVMGRWARPARSARPRRRGQSWPTPTMRPVSASACVSRNASREHGARTDAVEGASLEKAQRLRKKRSDVSQRRSVRQNQPK